MTYEQIQQVDYYLADIQKLQHLQLSDEELFSKAKTLDAQIRSSVDGYNPKGISWNTAKISLYQSSYYDKKIVYDFLGIMFACLRAVWNAIPNREKILEVGEDVDIGNSLKDAVKSNKQDFIVNMVNKYRSEIVFGDEVFNVAKKLLSKIKVDEQQTRLIYRNVLNELERYLNLLCEIKPNNEGGGMATGIQINNNLIGGNASANASASAQVNVDISVQIEQTIEKVKEACLSPEEEVAILAKLDELKGIAKEKNIRTRWDKVKGVFKWLAEQSLQAASWIVPLIAQLMQVT